MLQLRSGCGRSSFWHLRVWQLVTYMFLHGGVFHILFNMLALWMFGAELERMWGTRVLPEVLLRTGIGAGVLTVCFRCCRSGSRSSCKRSIIIGASGAIYGLLLAYALYFPDRPILHVLRVPDPGEDTSW